MGDGKPRRRGFQSTPPVKAATASLLQSLGGDTISIHAAREGGDEPLCIPITNIILFQSTPPVKAATIQRLTNSVCYQISIHAAREGGDAQAWYITPLPLYFNPRRP